MKVSIKFRVAALMESIVGRRNLVRGSRFFLDYARRDLPNRLDQNGEWMIQDVAMSMDITPQVIFDIGSNVGLWTDRLVRKSALSRVPVVVHAFEPSATTYALLVENLSLHGFRDQVIAVHAAASDHSGTGTLYKVHELAGSNSLHGIAGKTDGLEPESITLVSLDEYCTRAHIGAIHLLKIDAEGHDFLVLMGARKLLAAQAVRILQFEYNFRWIGARHYLKDVFDLLQPLGYMIGKVTPRSVEWYSSWSPELETFREANYIAALPTFSTNFPSIEWWNPDLGTSQCR